MSDAGDGPGVEPGTNAVSQLDRVKQEYTAAAREILRRSMQGVARTKLTPDMLSIAGLALCVAVVAVFAVVFAVAPEAVVAAYTTDPALRATAVPLITVCAWILIVDAGQGVMANALRGRGETWAPMLLHTISYLGVMIPLAYLLAFPVGADRGVLGLFEATFIASVVSIALLSARFAWLGWQDRRDEEHRSPGDIRH